MTARDPERKLPWNEKSCAVIDRAYSLIRLTAYITALRSSHENPSTGLNRCTPDPDCHNDTSHNAVINAVLHGGPDPQLSVPGESHCLTCRIVHRLEFQ